MSAVIVSKKRVQALSSEKYREAFGCGDWRFYREILEKGDVVFNSDRLNFHRRHERSVFGNDQNRVKNECELIEYQAEILKGGRIAPGIHELVIKEIQSRPSVSTEVDARKAFLLAKTAKLADERLKVNGKEGILIVIPDFGAGGGQLVAVDIANEYVRRGDINVYMCSARGYHGTSRAVLRRIDPKVIVLNSENVSLASIEKLNIKRIQSHVYWADKYVYERQLYKAANWCISMHGCYNDFIGREAAYRDFVPLSDIGMWFEQAQFIQVCARKHFKAIQHFAPACLANTELIWNGLATCDETDASAPSLFDDSDSSVHVVMTGRWEPSKGWKLVKDAFSILKSSKQKDLGKCYLIGPSEDDFKKAWGSDWNERGYFVVTGELPLPVAVYGSAKLIGTLPSYFHSESQPRVVSEFFSKGIPVVTSEVGDLKQIVAGEDGKSGGITIPISGANHNPDDLARAFADTIEHYSHYSDGAKAQFEEFLDIKKSVERIDECWRKKKENAS